MTSIANNTVVKVAAVVAGLVLAFTLAVPSAHAALTESQIQSILSLLQSFGADASTVANVESSLRGTVPSTPSTPSTGCYAFTRDLTVGSQGADVTALQAFLRAKGNFTHPTDTGYFGPITQAAVSAWQSASGVTPPAGYFGPISRAAYNTQCSTGPSTGPTTPAPGTGLAVSAPAQPANSLAPQSATYVPFTKFTLTAGNDGDVVVNSVTVQRVGLGSNASFDGVVLLDETGRQVGDDRTFNSNDQANIGEKVTIPRGTSRTFTVAGNMASSLSSYAGEAPAISVIGVNTSATVTGSLPITGAYHTINATLSVGKLLLDVSSANAANDPVSKEIGTTQFRVTGFRVTADSSEDVRFRAVRFAQTGSVSAGDLANVMVYVGGTGYPAVASADGKWYDASFGSGILIPSGNNVEIYATYDIVGTNSAGRTVIFDIDERTDIYATGETYNYGIAPAAGSTAVSSLTRSSSKTTETSGTPYIYGNQVTVTGGSVTTFTKDNAVPAQNVAPNVPNQPLGGFQTDIKGEGISVTGITVTVGTSSGSGTGVLTNVTIVDENGAVVAGPQDANAAGTSLAFTDAVTFPVGKHSYTIRGKIASGIGNNTIYTLTLNPSSGLTNPKGDITGDTITISQGSFNMNAVTVKTGALAVGRSTNPPSQTLVSGGVSVPMVAFQFDATNSGEDVRFSSVPVALDVDASGVNFEGDPDFLSGCQLFDGSNALNSGSNVLNPSNTATTSDDTDTLTLDNPVTVTKGNVKTLQMRCNISSSVPNNSQYVWTVNDAATNLTVNGVLSGTTITATNASDSAVVVTIGNGSGAVSTDASSPGYKIVAGGATDVTVGAFKLRATNEPLTLQNLGLQLTNTASSSARDLRQDIASVSIWDGATKVGDATFTGSNTTATSSLSGVTLPKDTDKVLIVKANLSEIGVSESATSSGKLVAVDFLAGETVGQNSGSTIWLTGSTATAGVRVFNSVPSVAKVSLASTGIQDGDLLAFSVTADSKDSVGLTSFKLNLATTTLSVTNINIFGYENSNFTGAISGVSANGQLQAANASAVDSSGNVTISVQDNAGTATVIQVPKGETRYFKVTGSVAGVVSGASVTTKLNGDSAFHSTAASGLSNFMVAAASLSASNFLWSPNSTGTAVRADADWTNGFGINGLPSSGLTQTRSQ